MLLKRLRIRRIVVVFLDLDVRKPVQAPSRAPAPSSFLQTVAILMSNKERAADIGRIERRILQPQVARDMDRMGKEKRAEFGGRVQTAVERMVYAAKRRYVLRQEKLDKAGIFHSDANAQRWA